MKKKFSIIAFFFIAGIILAGGITYSAVKEAYRNKGIEKEVAELKQQAQKIQNENGQLSEKIAYLETPEFQEKVAKEKLNLQKPDENVVVVRPSVDGKPVAGDSVQADNSDSGAQIPNYRKWWDVFFKYD